MIYDDDPDPLSIAMGLTGRHEMPQPTNNRDADAYKDIGWLRGQLEALKDAVEANGIEARKGRERMYAEITAANTGVAELKSQVASVSDQMTDLSERVKKTEEKLTTYNNWTQQLKGSWRTIAFFWVLVGGAAAYVGKMLLAKAGAGQ